MKKPKMKLALTRETVANLSGDLTRVLAGGTIPPKPPCETTQLPSNCEFTKPCWAECGTHDPFLC